MDYKVGDIALIINNGFSYYHKGDIGIIHALDRNDTFIPVRVEFSDLRLINPTWVRKEDFIVLHNLTKLEKSIYGIE